MVSRRLTDPQREPSRPPGSVRPLSPDEWAAHEADALDCDLRWAAEAALASGAVDRQMIRDGRPTVKQPRGLHRWPIPPPNLLPASMSIRATVSTPAYLDAPRRDLPRPGDDFHVDLQLGAAHPDDVLLSLEYGSWGWRPLYVEQPDDICRVRDCAAVGEGGVRIWMRWDQAGASSRGTMRRAVVWIPGDLVGDWSAELGSGWVNVRTALAYRQLRVLVFDIPGSLPTAGVVAAALGVRAPAQPAEYGRLDGESHLMGGSAGEELEDPQSD